MTDSPWRKHANKVIARVVGDNPGLPEYELRKLLSAAYPFGERKYHPYKIWLSAINEHFDPRPTKGRKAKTVIVNEGQLPLLEARLASIDAAIAEVKAEAIEWRPVADGCYELENLYEGLTVEDDGAVLWTTDRSYPFDPSTVRMILPDHIRLCQRVIGSQEAQDE